MINNTQRYKDIIMIRMYRKLFLLMTCVLSLTSCDEDIMSIVSDFENRKSAEEKVEIIKYRFTPDCKYIYLDIKQTSELNTFVLNDTNRVKVDVTLSKNLLFGEDKHRNTSLVSIKQVGSEFVDSLEMRMLVLADLTLPQYVIDQEYYAVREIRNLYTSKNLYISFITPNGITNFMPAENEIIDYAFTRKDSADKYLYRSISTAIEDLSDSTNSFSLTDLGTLFVMSDAHVYNDDSPIDPANYEIQEKLVEQAEVLGAKNNISIYYANFRHDEATPDPAAVNMMKLICKKTHGEYTENFDWPTMKRAILSRFNLDIPDFQIKLVNADGTVFKGGENRLVLSFLNAKNDSLLVKAETKVVAGNIFNPIIVNGRSTRSVVFQGISTVLFLIVITFIIFQYIIPFIRYRLFLRKYVTKYTGGQMVFGDFPVQEKCYYCKAPFEKGDEIVVKCQHVMHKGCWDENGHHCTEYGRHCKEGSHYYNSDNLNDPKNASFYMKWIIMSFIAGLMAWLIFTLRVTSFSAYLMEQFIQFMYDIKPSDAGYQEQINELWAKLQQSPIFGFSISFTTTLFFSFLSVFRKKHLKYYSECFLRALIASIGGWLSFELVAVFVVAMNIASKSFLLSWVPWPLTGCVIAFCVTWHTRIRFRNYWILVSLLLGLISMGLWGVFYVDSLLDFRGAVLISHLVFSVGMGLCIAKDAPRSEHYFLHVEGAIKTMDIALYKWLANNEEGAVTIGKSVDCDLQMSWDVNSVIAPKQAEIRFSGSRLCLTPIDEGVYTAEEMIPIGKSLPLYHGTNFTIGKTIFTYLEKDF